MTAHAVAAGRRLVLMTLVVALAACGSLGGRRSGNPEQDVRAHIERQVAAWNAGDLDGFMAGYDKSDALRIVANGKEERGWDRTLARYRSRYTTRAAMGELRYSDLEVHVVDKDHAWAYGHWTLVRGKDHPHGVLTLVLTRGLKGWRIVHDQSDGD